MGKKHGIGREEITIFGDTIEYEGTFRDGERNGYGIRASNDWKYIGEWYDGKRQGYGTTIFGNGFAYVGFYAENQRSGQGTLFYPDGSTFVGSFERGRPLNGERIDGDVFVGVYKNGIYEQIGEHK